MHDFFLYKIVLLVQCDMRVKRMEMRCLVRVAVWISSWLVDRALRRRAAWNTGGSYEHHSSSSNQHHHHLTHLHIGYSANTCALSDKQLHTQLHSHHGVLLRPRLHWRNSHTANACYHEQSLRMVPQKGHAQQTALAPSAPAAPGVHDTLRSNQSLNTPHNASPAFSAVASSHPLEARLSNWRSTQDSLKMTMLRREFGVGEPVRRGMEVKICQEGEWRPAVLGYKGEGVHEQILSGRDASVDWEDVFNGECDPDHGDEGGC